MNKNIATSIMFEEIKAQLQTIENKLKNIKQDDITSKCDLEGIKQVIGNIKAPIVDTQSVETLISDIKVHLVEATNHIEKLVQKKEESKVVNHIHSVQIKSIKVCIAFSALYVLLMISVYFNFR